MNCQKCGCQLSPDAKFCKKCGTAVTQQMPVQSEEYLQFPKNSAEQPKEYSDGSKRKKKSDKKLPLVIVAVVLIIAVIAGASFTAYTIIEKNKEKTTQAETENSTISSKAESVTEDVPVNNGSENSTADLNSEISKIKKMGKLAVGITEYPPMNYKDADGEWTGFDAELANAFAERLGVTAEFVVLADWDGKFVELGAGTIDCVWNGMTITDEARNSSSVSEPYAQSSQVVVLPADIAANVKSVDDLKNYTFAVAEGSAGQDVAEDKGLKSVACLNMAMALLEANSGACDGCIIDKTMADATVGEGANLAIAMTLSTEEFGVAFRQNSDLTAEFNKFLAEYRESGELAKLAEKYGVEIK